MQLSFLSQKVDRYYFWCCFEFAHLNAEQGDNDIWVYTGTFDVIDKEGDDQATLFGLEHRDNKKFRKTKCREN